MNFFALPAIQSHVITNRFRSQERSRAASSRSYNDMFLNPNPAIIAPPRRPHLLLSIFECDKQQHQSTCYRVPG